MRDETAKKLFWGCLFVSLMIGGLAAAQNTPDVQTPANEGLCDDLMFATPGLYEPCIAFCEARDCEVDMAAADPPSRCAV